MGECGCSSGNEVIRLRAPVGWYVLHIHRPCRGCDAGISMEVEAVDDDDMEARDLRRHTADLSGPGLGTVGAVNILPETELFAALRPSVSGMVSKDDGAGMDTDDDDCWGMIIDEAAGAVSGAMSLKVVAVADK